MNYRRILLLSILPLGLVPLACGGTPDEEVSSSEEALTHDALYKGTYGFIGSVNGDIQEITLGKTPMFTPTPVGAVAFGAYSAQVDARVLDPAFVCPVELSPCTFNESGSWSVVNDGTGKQKLVLTPSSGGAARQYFTTLPMSATSGVIGTFRVGSASGPELRLRKQTAPVSLVSETIWGSCNAGFHTALIEPGNTPLPAGRVGTASIRTRCVPNIADCTTVAIEPRTELMITHPNVVRDPVRARNTTGVAGRWTLGRLIQDMIPSGNSVTAAAAFQSMLQSMASANAPGVSFDNQPRSAATMNAFIAGLPKLADGATIDMDRIHRTNTSPSTQKDFELVAIAYRPDLQLADADSPSKVGEARFVFTRSDSFTVINEYTLPIIKVGTATLTTAQSRRIWALRFRALGTHPAFGEGYRALLERITTGFAGPGAKKVGVSTPNGNAISQIRTNDIELGSPWQVREYNLRFVAGAARIIPVTTKENPAREVRLGLASANGAVLRTQLLSVIDANQAAILGGTFSMPAQFLGSSADTFSGEAYGPLFEGSAIPTPVQNALIANTCNGCHNNVTGETPSHRFTHIRQLSSTIGDAANLNAGQDRLSSFVNSDMVHRESVMRGLLCSGPVLGPEIIHSSSRRPH